MSGFEEEDDKEQIDKIFQEIISSDDLESISSNLGENLTLTKNNNETLLKELVFIHQALSQSCIHIGELILDIQEVQNYKMEDELAELLGSLYKIAEDFDDYMLELLLKENEAIGLIESDEEDYQDEDYDGNEDEH